MMNSLVKRVIAGALFSILAINIFVVASNGKMHITNEKNSKKNLAVYVNNKKLNPGKTKPLKLGKGYLVPGKKFVKLMKIKYSYKKSKKTVILRKKSKKIQLKINKKFATLKNRKFKLKVKTKLKSKTPMFDAVTIAKKFGYKYSKYFANSNCLIVANKKKYLVDPGTITSPDSNNMPGADSTNSATEGPTIAPSLPPKPTPTVVPTYLPTFSPIYTKNFEDNSTLFTEYYGETPDQQVVSGGANGTGKAISLTGTWLNCRSFPNVTLKTNTDYRLSFYIKGKIYQGTLILPDDTRYTLFNYDNAPEITDWRKIEFTFSTGSSIGSARDFEFRVMTGDGTIYIDELLLEEKTFVTAYVTITPTIPTIVSPIPTPSTPAGAYPSISIDPNGGKAGSTYAYRTTGLPVCFINTDNKKNPNVKGSYQSGIMCIEETGDAGTRLLNPLHIQIAVRGNSTSNAQKKPYNIKFTDNADGTKNKQEVLGMTAHHKWSLLAGAYDKSLLRNAVALNFASQLSGLDFTADFRFVDVVLNGEYVGHYMLTERVEIADARVNIKKKNDTKDKFGYIVEWDQRSKQSWTNKELGTDYFLANVPGEGQVAFAYKDPERDDFEEDGNNTRKTYIANDVQTIWNKISQASNSNADFLNYIDIDSFIDYYMVQELMMPIDGYNFSSIYFYKDCTEGAKMHAGPAWDYDLALGNTNPSSINSIFYRSAAYCSPLRNHSATKQKYKDRWKTIQPIAANMLNYIDTTAQQIKKSAELNYKRWPISSVDIYSGSTVFSSFDAAVTSLRSLYQTRYNTMNSAFNSWW